MATETWYVMEDGSNGDPNEIAPDEKGVLRHKDGRTVAYAPHGPRSRSLDADAERAKQKPRSPVEKPTPDDAQRRDMTPEQPKRHYQTRGRY